MAMSKRTRTVLIVIGVAVAAYLVYRWYQNRQASPGTVDTTGTGSNLNSLAPELVAGSQGPSSGLTYTPGNETVDLTLPGGGPSQDITGSDTESEDQDNDVVPVHGPIPTEPCPLGFRRDPKSRKCVKITCPPGHTLDWKTQQCVPVKKPPPRRPPPKRRKKPIGPMTG